MPGGCHVGLPQLIGIGLVLCVWLFNYFGVRIGMAFGYVAGAILMIPLFVMMILPFLNGSFDSDNLTYKLNDPGLAWGGIQLALVWLWIMCWSAWGVDVCATFAPEYKDTARDTKMALRSAALFSMFVYIVLPIAFVGGGTEKLVSGYLYPQAMDKIIGSTRLTDFLLVCLCISFVISMNTATADGGRALLGISRDGMTIKWLGKLNRFNVPGNGMTVDMFVNIGFLLFIGNNFGILAASNLGYVLAHMFALSGFVLLRRDRPNWPRPIKLSAVWVPIAGILAVWCAILTIVGFGWMQVASGGYGETKEKIIGVLVLADRDRPLPLPPHRPGRRAAALAGGDADDARGHERAGARRERARHVARRACDRRGRAARCRSGSSGRQNRGMSSQAPPPEEFELVLPGFAPGALEGLGDSAFDEVPTAEQIDVGDLDDDPSLAFRRTLGMFATGVTVLTTRVGDQVHGMTANAFMSVSLHPAARPDLDRPPRAHDAGCSTRARATASACSRRTRRRSPTSSRAARSKGSSRSSSSSATRRSWPVALAHFVARVVRSYWGGDHSLFLGQVEYARYGEGEPLLFHGGRYERMSREPQLFSQLPQELLDQLLLRGHELRFGAGETLMTRGEVSDTLMLITAGSVRMERPGRTMSLGPGSLVGEIEVLNPGPGRMATITAEEETAVIAVTRAELLEGLAADPRAAIALLEILAGRFRETG